VPDALGKRLIEGHQWCVEPDTLTGKAVRLVLVFSFGDTRGNAMRQAVSTDEAVQAGFLGFIVANSNRSWSMWARKK
jgi:hypothetical protein